MKTFHEEALLVSEYERRLAQQVGAPEMQITYKWLILAATEGDRFLRTPGEVVVSDEEEERLHELFRQKRAERRAAIIAAAKEN